MTRTRHAILVLLFAFAALAGAGGARVLAQECVLDRCLNEDGGAPVERRLRASVAPGDFDYYVLALSWSPGYCALSAGSRDREQCESGAGLGFVVHGLWPQRDGALIADCEAGLRPPSRSIVFSVRDLYPSEGLARYQWRKHGGCTGLSPAAYFADVRRAREAVVTPPDFPHSAARLAPEDVLRAFREANPRLRPGMASVSCPKGVLQEVRICLSKDLRDFMPCPELMVRSCRSRQIEAPPVL